MADEPDTAAVAEAAAMFREDHDEGENALETVLAIDAEHDTWTFDELPLGSGTFGELVSRGIVTKVDGEYRLASRRGVKAGLAGEEISGQRSNSTVTLSNPIPFDARAAVGLIGALVLLFAMRVVNYQSVFYRGHIVSPANDPYHYRYWLEELVANSDGITDTSVIASLPDRAAERRPLTHSTNWFFAELLGGDQWAAEMVAAWLPVFATIVLGVVVYWIAVIVTNDVRVGVASVLLLALTPVHAVYTSLGFLEHRLHQYFWIGVTLLTLAWLAVDLQRRREGKIEPKTAIHNHLLRPWTWVASVTLGIALALSTHSWGGSILLLIPVATYVGLKVAIDVRAGLLPALANLPVLVGLGIGGLLAALLHFRLGWHETFTAIVPLIVVGAAVAVVGFGEFWRRLDWPVGALVGLEAVIACSSLVGLYYLWPEVWMRLYNRAFDLFFREGFAESTSIFALENAIIFGPLAQFGFGFYLAVLVLAWTCWIAYRRYEPAWLLLSVYAIFWLVMATFQGRFAAQLAIPLSVLGGLGLVWLFAWLDLARAPAPFHGTNESKQNGSETSRGPIADGGSQSPSIIVPRDSTTIIALVWIGLLILGMSLFFVPSMTAQATHSETKIDAAMAIDDHAAATDREYPANFVLSEWGDNRMYNYLVSGESDRYGFAEGHFEDFQTDSDPDEWYGLFEQRDIGYVVMTDTESEHSEGSSQVKLHGELGTGGDREDSLSHYQAIYVSDDVTAFAVVPGATLNTTGEPGETVTVTTEVTLSNETVLYERTETVGDDGTVEITVPYPGEYTVDNRAVDVSTEAVENGSTIELD